MWLLGLWLGVTPANACLYDCSRDAVMVPSPGSVAVPVDAVLVVDEGSPMWWIGTENHVLHAYGSDEVLDVDWRDLGGRRWVGVPSQRLQPDTSYVLAVDEQVLGTFHTTDQTARPGWAPAIELAARVVTEEDVTSCDPVDYIRFDLPDSVVTEVEVAVGDSLEGSERFLTLDPWLVVGTSGCRSSLDALEPDSHVTYRARTWNAAGVPGPWSGAVTWIPERTALPGCSSSGLPALPLGAWLAGLLLIGWRRRA